MAIFPLGIIVKNRREELGLTQEDLSDGICSVPTLSRIENGERMPSKNIYEMLMQRLGYSSMSMDYFTDKREFILHELKFKIRQAYVFEDRAQAKQQLEIFRKTYKIGIQSDTQFVMLYDVLLNENEYTNQQKLDQLEYALGLTCPQYRQGKLPRIFSYEEIILLNNIAICFADGGECDKAIAILKTLKDYYTTQVVNTEEAIRTQLMVLYNLSKYLGQNGDYDECIEICNLGIRIAKKTGRCLSLHKTLYNKSWALLMRGDNGDHENAKKALERAMSLADALGYRDDYEFIDAFYKKHY